METWWRLYVAGCKKIQHVNGFAKWCTWVHMGLLLGPAYYWDLPTTRTCLLLGYWLGWDAKKHSA